MQNMVNSKTTCLPQARKFGNGVWLAAWSVPSATSNRRSLKQKVFLPAAGNRNGTDVNNVGSNGNYWSSSANDNNNAYHVYFDDNYVDANYDNVRLGGFSVRVVQEVEE